jgi:UDP-3-O-[3-hydroxymyristoyl] N-acetylglucosamine deacetylase
MTLNGRQHTLASPVTCSGVGVHSGCNVHLTVRPAPENHGIRFARTDLPDSPTVAALFNRVVDTSLATVIGDEGCIVSTIEHLMACFSGLSIDNALVELDAYEMPIMDGSAAPFTRLLRSVGFRSQEAPRHCIIIKEPIELREGDKFVGAYPSHQREMSCGIEYDHPLIRQQTIGVHLTRRVFEYEIAPARTFGFLYEVEHLKRFGLARGGSLDNAVVIDGDQVLNPGGLRFPDEFVRHKLLDCIGDFSLLGMPIIGRIVTHKSGHALNHAFLEKIFTSKKAWETGTIPIAASPLPALPKALAI